MPKSLLYFSAGVGRSGTFIALDRLLQQIETKDIIDVYGIVHEMRMERVWMVQTEVRHNCWKEVSKIFLYQNSRTDSNRTDTLKLYFLPHRSTDFKNSSRIGTSSMGES